MSDDAIYEANAPALLASMDREWRRCVVAVFSAATEHQMRRIILERFGQGRPPLSEASLRADGELAVRDDNFSLFVAYLAARGPDTLLQYVTGAKRLQESRLSHSADPENAATVAAQDLLQQY